MSIMNQPLHDQTDTLNIPPMALRRHVEASRRLDDIFRAAERGEPASSILIRGKAGQGKTMALEAFVAKHPAYDEEDRTIFPVIGVEVPATLSTAAVAKEILRKMNAPAAGNSASELTSQVKTLLRECQVKVLVLDEVQHLVERGQVPSIRRLADWLKSLINQTGVTLVLMGIPSSQALLRYNDQLRRRFSAPWQIPEWSRDCQEDVEEFCGFLNVAQQAVGIPFSVNLADPNIAERIFLACNGSPGNVEKLLIKTRQVARERDVKEIGVSELHEGFCEGFDRYLHATRMPFHDTFDNRPLTNPGEPFASDKE